jgi:2-oxoglutarate ferredoxin oxidoreductase subunit alpha
MNGNQGIALGALSAGIKFYSFYPMSPSTLLGVTLAAHMDKLPLVVEQAEDEIAAINMAIGASVAGAPAMVGTSGGGFALMTEAVSFAAVSETPLVVLVAQRPGPATGLPTRTEQADLELVLHGGHGEFPKAILAPGTVEQCFYLTRKAFELAETTQSQVFVLTDQYLSDCYQAVHEFDIENLKPIEVGGDAGQVASPYQRYELTSSGVSPRLIPGKNKHLVVTDSHEHTEDGHMTEEAKCRVRMVKKRLQKMKLIERETIQPEFVGDKDADLVLLCWGSTRDSAIEAAAMLNERGTRAAALHFSQVWPLVPEHFMKYLEAAREVVSVESNAFGQFARLLRRETGFAVARTVLKYDGRVITPEYILRELGEE